MLNNYRMVLDTETTNDIECPLVYDIGWVIVDREGKVVKSCSYVVADIFCDKSLMESAYFAEKIPMYWEQIKSGERILTSFYKIRQEFIACCKRYDLKEFFAHNACFDYKAIQTTERYLTKSKYRFWFPYEMKVCDTLKMCREIFKEDNEYLDYCSRNGYLTTNNAPRFTAEIVYRFLTQDNEFVEEHTGIEDALIEKDIMTYCFEREPSINPYLWEECA